MDNNSYESIVNWTNKLGNSYNTKFIQACAECESCKCKGFDRDEAVELLMAKGFGHPEGLSEIIDEVYGVPEVKKVKAEVYVVPTSYDDVQHIIEEQLINSGPESFVSYLTDSADPIMRINANHKKTLIKLAKSALENSDHFKFLHEEIKPFIEEAMLNSVLLAEKSTDYAMQKFASSKFGVIINGKEAMVDLNAGNSSGERYVRGNFNKFGLADEYLVKAHDTASPYVRLKKEITN